MGIEFLKSPTIIVWGKNEKGLLVFLKHYAIENREQAWQDFEVLRSSDNVDESYIETLESFSNKIKSEEE